MFQSQCIVIEIFNNKLRIKIIMSINLDNREDHLNQLFRCSELLCIQKLFLVICIDINY